MKIDNNKNICNNLLFNDNKTVLKNKVIEFPFSIFQLFNNINFLIGKSFSITPQAHLKLPPHLSALLPQGPKTSPIAAAIENKNYKQALKLTQKQKLESLPIDASSASALLAKTLKTKNFELFNYLMKTPGIDVNIPDESNKTAIHYALKRGQVQNAEKLLKMGADLKKEDKNGMTPVHEALNLNSVKFLVKNHVDLGKKDHLGTTLLHRAIATGRDEIVKYLSKTSPELFNMEEKELVELGKGAVMQKELLLPHFSKSCSKGRDSKTLETLSFLAKEHPKMLTAKDENGQTLLHHAYKYGTSKTVKTLLANGANPHVRDMRKRTPFGAGLEQNSSAKLFTQMKKEHLSDAYHAFSNVAKKHPKIGDSLLSLLQARNPSFYNSEKPRDKKLNGFLTEVNRLAAKKAPWLKHTLEHVLKMNHKIPLSKSTLQQIDHLSSQVKGDKKLKTKLFLALQTHPNINEVANAMNTLKHTDMQKAFNNDFFNQPFVKQLELLNTAEVFRMRKAVPVAGDIIKQKENMHPKLIEKGLRVLEKAGIPQKQKHFFDILEDKKINQKTKIQTLKTMSNTIKDPANLEDKNKLAALLKTNPQLSSEICNVLSKYTFKTEDSSLCQDLLDLSKECKNPKALQGFAKVLTLLPNEAALEQALTIVNGPTWDHIDKKSHLKNRDEHIGNFNMFTHKPDFLQNRDAMRKIIAERMVNLKWDSIKEDVETKYQQYLDRPEQFQSLEKVKNKIHSLNPTQRHIPFGLYLPKDRVVMRGISSKKGDTLGQAAFVDLLTKGAGSSDLSLFTEKANGTWSKVGQTFTSTSLKYVLDGDYFNADGSLMAIDSDYLNEQMLRGEGRFEKENKINPISFSTIPHHAFKKLFIPRAEQEEISKLAKGDTSLKTGDGVLKDVSRRVLKRISKKLQDKTCESGPLYDRIGYVDTPKKNESFKTQMKEKLSIEGLKPIKVKDLVQENIKRQIAKQILQSTLQNPDLKKCMQIACI